MAEGLGPVFAAWGLRFTEFWGLRLGVQGLGLRI